MLTRGYPVVYAATARNRIGQSRARAADASIETRDAWCNHAAIVGDGPAFTLRVLPRVLDLTADRLLFVGDARLLS